MNSIMYPNLSSEPIFGLIAVVLILVCLFLFTGIKLGDLFTTEGFVRIYSEKPWVIYLAIAITVYALMSIWRHNRTASLKQAQVEKAMKSNNLEGFGDTQSLMTFDNFFKKHFMLQPSEGAEKMENTYMILRTRINGHNYYLVIKSDTEDNIYSRIPRRKARKEIMCRNCKVNDKYVRPVLMREDVLKKLYESFLFNTKEQIANMETMKGSIGEQMAKKSDSQGSMPTLTFNSPSMPDSSDTFDGTVGGIINIKSQNKFEDHVETFLADVGEALTRGQNSEEEKKIYYPRFIHHLDISYQPEPGSLYDSSDNEQDQNQSQRPQSPAYNISGMHGQQVINLEEMENQAPYLLTSLKAFSNIPPESPEDRVFVCAKQTASNFLSSNPRNAIYSESYAPLLNEMERAEESEESEASEASEASEESNDMSESKVISDPSMIADYEKLVARVNLYFFNKDKKYYIARLNGFKPRNDQSTTSNSESESEEEQQIPKMYPVGMVPENYSHPEILDANVTDYSFAEKINFDVLMVKLSPMN